MLHRGDKPAKAWVRIPALLPGERTSTVVEPGRFVFGAQLPTIEKHELLDAAVCVGFFWADEPRNAAAVLTTAWDSSAAAAAAEELAHGFWEQHREFQIVSDYYGDWDQALDFALDRPDRPLYISDSGDNVTAGGTGDITHALERTIAHPSMVESGLRFLFAGMWDPETLAAAAEAGVGGVLDRAIGACYDDRYGQPVAGPWQVAHVTTDPDGQAVEALLRHDNVDVIVRADRKAFIGPDDQASGDGNTHRTSSTPPPTTPSWSRTATCSPAKPTTPAPPSWPSPLGAPTLNTTGSTTTGSADPCTHGTTPTVLTYERRSFRHGPHHSSKPVIECGVETTIPLAVCSLHGPPSVAVRR